MSDQKNTPTGLYPPGSLGEQLIEYFHDDACRDVLLRQLKKRSVTCRTPRWRG